MTGLACSREAAAERGTVPKSSSVAVSDLGAAPRSAAASRLHAAVLVVVALGLIMHGCHGADDDHEPAVAPPHREVSP